MIYGIVTDLYVHHYEYEEFNFIGRIPEIRISKCFMSGFYAAFNVSDLVNSSPQIHFSCNTPQFPGEGPSSPSPTASLALPSAS